MPENKKEKRTTPPYLAYKTFVNFLDRLKIHGVPSRVDRSIVGSFSGAVQNQLFTTLKYLGLIEEGGKPTEMLSRLVCSEDPDLQKSLKEIVATGYPFLFSKSIDLKTITYNQLQELFIEAGASGDTLRKSIKFFHEIAKAAEIELSPYIKKTRTYTRRGAPGKNIKIEEGKAINSQLPDESYDQFFQSGSLGWQQLLLSKFPAFDPAWSDEVKKEWFTAFSRLMDEFKKRNE